MDFDSYFETSFDAHESLLAPTRSALKAPLSRLVDLCADALGRGGKILFFGNGGSAADSQHLAAEFCCRFVHDRPALAALALTTDSSALTAIGNDYGFEHIFSRQIAALGQKDDVAIAFSTSGNSPNVIAGLKAAREKGLVAAGFGGGDGGKMKALADPVILVPSKDTARIQEMHITLGHILCGAVEKKLGL